jgi:hypothetical protein
MLFDCVLYCHAVLASFIEDLRSRRVTCLRGKSRRMMRAQDHARGQETGHCPKCQKSRVRRIHAQDVASIT